MSRTTFTWTPPAQHDERHIYVKIERDGKSVVSQGAAVSVVDGALVIDCIVCGAWWFADARSAR